MNRLSRYLIVQFMRDSVALYLVATLLVWLTQMLRLFDLITAKGQGLITLAGQAFLTTPPLAREIVYICMAIGLARAFKALQNSRELHTIHITRRLSAIWSALAVYAVAGALVALFLAHWAEPVSRHTAVRWSAEIAAELVGENLTPGRFTEIADGVVLHIGGRLPDGTITDFFADDSRQPDGRRTYIAETAIIVSTDDGYQISLRNGRLESAPLDDKYSEVEFARYELSLDSLTDPIRVRNPLLDRDSYELVQRAIDRGRMPKPILTQLNRRNAEGLRVIAICLLVAALLAFPHARRGKDLVPIELAILIVAFGERSISGALSIGSGLGYYIGPVVLLLVASIILAIRFRPRKSLSPSLGANNA